MTLPSNAIPLIVTSAITINASRTRLTASHERLRLTLEALKVWMTISAFPRIVVCDGSGFDMAPHLQQLSEQGNRNVAFESLCFHNDSAMVAKLGMPSHTADLLPKQQIPLLNARQNCGSQTPSTACGTTTAPQH